MFPPVPLDVLLALSNMFPERSPNIGEDPTALMVRAGQASVVRFLKRIFDEQNEDVLTTEMTQDVPA